jgi:multiple sugar transport system ATP-binding protein
MVNEKMSSQLLDARLLDKQVVLGIRPEYIGLYDGVNEGNARSFIEGGLLFDEFVGYDRFYHLDIGMEKPLLMRANTKLRHREGDKITVAADMDNALFYHPETEMLLTD